MDDSGASAFNKGLVLAILLGEPILIRHLIAPKREVREEPTVVQSDTDFPVWTVGHSTRPIGEFIALLQSAAITLIGDVRRFPGSRRYPQYNQRTLTEALATDGIGYLALPELGGRRRSRSDSPHTAWRNSSFRGYADYMDTDAFRHAMDRVITLADRQRIALMCSEAVWWRCHRALIADYLKIRGYPVIHLLSPTKHETHPFTTAARIVDGQLSYARAAT